MVLQNLCLNQKKNVIDPENIINNYGADSVRLFILSDSPPEKDVQWSEQGMVASYKFLQKLWALHKKIKNKINSNIKISEQNLILEKFTNQMINKITGNLESFNYNVIIASIYETYNFLNKEIESNLDSETLKKNYKNIIILFWPKRLLQRKLTKTDLKYNCGIVLRAQW